MVKKIDEILNDPNYQKLSEEAKGIVRKKYFESTVVKDPNYTKLSPEAQVSVAGKILGTQNTVVQNVPQELPQETIRPRATGTLPERTMQPMNQISGVGSRGRLPGNVAKTGGSTAQLRDLQTTGSDTDLARNLLTQGYSVDAIRNILTTEKGLKPKMFETGELGENIGGTIGGIGLPIAAGALGVTNPIALAGLGIAGAAGLGMAGRTAEKKLTTGEWSSGNELAKAGVTQGAMELVGRGVEIVGRTGVNLLLKSKVKPEVELLQKSFGRYGGQFRPEQLTKGTKNKVYSGIAAGSIGGSEVIQADKVAQINALSDWANDVLDTTIKKFTPDTTEHIAKAIKEGASRNGAIYDEINKYYTPLYEKIMSRNKAAGFNRKLIIDKANELLNKNIAAHEELYSKDTVEWLKKLKTDPQMITFEGLKNQRSSWLEDSRKFKNTLNKDQHAYNDIIDAASDTLYGADPSLIKNMSKDDLDMYKALNTKYADTKKRWTEFLTDRGIESLDSNISNVYKEAFPPKMPDAVTNFKEVLLEPVKGGKKNILGEKLWNQLKHNWLEDTIKNSTSPSITAGEELFDPLKFAKKIKDMGDSIPAMFTKEELSELNKIIASGQVLRAKGEAIPIIVKTMQVGQGIAATYALSGLFIADKNGKRDNAPLAFTKAGAIALSPYILAKMMVSPRYSKLFIEGMKVKSHEVPSLAIRIGKMANEMTKDEDEKKRIESETKKMELYRESRRLTGNLGNKF